MVQLRIAGLVLLTHRFMEYCRGYGFIGTLGAATSQHIPGWAASNVSVLQIVFPTVVTAEGMLGLDENTGRRPL
jgi:hypothetical protein